MRYDVYAHLGVYFGDGRDWISAADDAIFVGGYSGWDMASGEREIINLIITDKPEARKTTILRRPKQPDTIIPEIVYPKTQ